MKIEWVIIAEGFGAGGNGAITAIGIDQVLIIASRLPANTKRAVLAHLVADDSITDKELTLAVMVLAPSGQVLAAQTAPVKIGAPQWPDIPITFNIFTDIPMQLTEYGTYVVDVKVTAPDGDSIEHRAEFYVCEPPGAKAHPTPELPSTSELGNS
jgi:hypothetical protein